MRQTTPRSSHLSRITFPRCGLAQTDGAGARAVPEDRLCGRRSAHPGRYDAHGQLCARSRGRVVELARLLPDARAPIRVRQLGPLPLRVSTPLPASEPYHLREQPRKLIHELLDLVLGHGSVGDLFRPGELGQLGAPGAPHAPRVDADEHRADRG